ncbi:MAG TPA: hypothetical protein VIC05_10585 [Solirubrobacteraceae bacterium]|jgi:hypothetical protein
MAHWFAIARAPVKLDSTGTPEASTLLAKSAQLEPSASEVLTANLTPAITCWSA